MTTANTFFVSDLDNGGAEYFWTMTGDTALSMLCLALGSVLPENSPFFALTVPSSAIRSAAEDLARSWSPKLRVADGLNGGIVIMRKGLSPEGKQVEIQVARVWLEGPGKIPHCTTESATDDVASALGVTSTDAATARVTALYNAARVTVSASGMGARLADLIKSLGGVSLRDKGGVWYVPPSGDATIRQVKEALATIGAGKVYRLPVMRAADAAEAILSALTAEIEEQTTEIQAWIAKQSESTAGAKTLENSQALRSQKISAMERKIAGYQAQLGLNVDGLANSLAALKNRVVNLRFLREDTSAGRGIPDAGDRGRLEIIDEPQTAEHPILGSDVKMEAPVTPQTYAPPVVLAESVDARFGMIEVDWD